LVDSPIMYSAPDYTSFMVDNMEIILAVYSPNNVLKAADITAEMETMMQAQKRFLGKINETKKYAILLYMSDMTKPDAQGFGALEHSTSTVVVFPEAMDLASLKQSMVDVVSHEFFHIVTPLSIHSEEIHYFDYNTPKMSKHLWIYEGVTEYFADLFQINQGLIDEDAYYQRMAQKILQAQSYDDKMPFTKMSASVLSMPYKDNYLNVYEKGALIAMCLDIELRSLSEGKMGILDLMRKLSEKYGINNPFKDEELFNDIVALTYPEIRTFLDTYVAGPTPIPYNEFLAKMGVSFVEQEIPGNLFLEGQSPFITIDRNTKEIVLLKEIELPAFYAQAGLKGGDFILSINDKGYNLDNIYDLINESMTWKDGDAIKITFRSEETKEVKTIETTVLLPKQMVEGLASDPAKNAEIREAWLKG
jgi:predicted metalloprotease with PDZ domain